MSSLLQLVTLMTISLCLLYTLTHVYTLGALVSAFSDKVWVTLISPLILWDSLAPLRLHSSLRASLWWFVCSLFTSPSQQGDLSLVLHNPHCWFLSNTNLFCLSTVCYHGRQQCQCTHPRQQQQQLGYTLCHLGRVPCARKNNWGLHCPLIMNRFK